MDMEVDILDTSNLQLDGDFDAQVQEILSFVRLTSEKVHNLKHLFDDLEHALQHMAPGCVIEPFGSVVTGLGIKTSDVDCYVALPPGEQPNTGHVMRARNILKRYHRKFTEIFAITTAKVPIVKFVHIPTQRQCDVNFKSPAGVYNSRLLAYLLCFDRRALPLAVLIKYWSKIHKFTGTNLLGNYALIVMVIFYLQLMNILPPVYELQRNVPSFLVDGWNIAFNEIMISDTTNNDTLYELMGGFFKCYSKFNFKESMISPFLGRVISKKCFENFDSVPEEFSLYKQEVLNDVRKKLKTTSMICIQDPFEHNRNCSIAVYDKLAERIIAQFQYASKMFEEDKDNSFLRAILTPNQHSTPTIRGKVHAFRKRISKTNHKPNKKGMEKGINEWYAEIKAFSNKKR